MTDIIDISTSNFIPVPGVAYRLRILYYDFFIAPVCEDWIVHQTGGDPYLILLTERLNQFNIWRYKNISINSVVEEIINTVYDHDKNSYDVENSSIYDMMDEDL